MLTVLTRICHFLSLIVITANYYVLPIQLTFFITILGFLVILGKMTSKQQHLHSFGYAEEQDANIEITKLEMLPLVKLPVLGEVVSFILNLMEKESKYFSYDRTIKSVAKDLFIHWVCHSVFPTFVKYIKQQRKCFISRN